MLENLKCLDEGERFPEKEKLMMTLSGLGLFINFLFAGFKLKAPLSLSSSGFEKQNNNYIYIYMYTDIYVYI